jgi:hypothetical protein
MNALESELLAWKVSSVVSPLTTVPFSLVKL